VYEVTKPVGLAVTFQLDEEDRAILLQILERLTSIEEKLMTTDEAIAALLAKVSAQGTVIESTITLLNGLSSQLQAAADDPVQIQEIIDQVAAQSDALAAAVAANTPAAPPA
jgi:transcriptional regulator